jgi:type II secretory pathway pseudopilin PulG
MFRMAISEPKPPLRDSEKGFTLTALLVLLTIISVVVAYSVPEMWSTALKRERDLQTIFAMKQYARAIQQFQQKRGVLPTSLEQLTEQNNPRVLRQEYICPLTGEKNWILVPPGAPPQSVPNPGGQGPTPGSAPQGAQPVNPGTGLTGEYVGPFVGVRPPVSGESFITFRDQDRYENWTYTINELNQENNPAPPQGVGSRPN